MKPICLPEPFPDGDGNGIIEFGTANRKKYGCRAVRYLGSDERGHWYADAADASASMPKPEGVFLPVVAPPRLDNPAPWNGTSYLQTSGAGPVKGNIRAVRDNGILMKSKSGISRTGIALTDMHVTGAYQLYRKLGGTLDGLLMERLLMEDIRYRPDGGKSMFINGGPLDNATFRDCKAIGNPDHVLTSPGDIYALWMLGGKNPTDIGRKFLFENCWGETSLARYANGYLNADIWSIEGGYGEVEFRNCYGRNASDAIYDIKSFLTTFVNCWGFDARAIFKLWAHYFRLYSIVTGRPRFAHLMCMNGADVEIDLWHVHESNPAAPLVQFEGGVGRVIVKKIVWQGGSVPIGQKFARRGDSKSKGSRLIVEGVEYLV